MVDFGKMFQEMAEERARKAALSPEEKAAEEAAEAAQRRARAELEDDARLFGDRALRTEKLCITETGGMLRDGGRRYIATNDKGPVNLVLPSDRYDEMIRGDQRAAGAAFDAALFAAEERRDGRGLPVEATGLFKSRSWTDSQGEKRTGWDFVATRIAFEHEGQRHTIGRDVRRADPVEKASTTQASTKAARPDRGDAR